MPFMIVFGIVGVALGTTAIFLLEEVQVTAKEVPEVVAGLGIGTLLIAGIAAYSFFKRG